MNISMRLDRRTWVRALLPLALAACAGSGTAAAAPADSPDTTSVFTFHDASYPSALAGCRLAKGGASIDRRSSTPATHPFVARCLARRGWTPDGTPMMQSARPAHTEP
jgi:hypothetical protein